MFTKVEIISGNVRERGFLIRFDGENIGVRVLDCDPRVWKYFNFETEQKELKNYLSSFRPLPVPYWEAVFEETY